MSRYNYTPTFAKPQLSYCEIWYCKLHQVKLSNNPWIHLLKLYKKRFQFADKLKTWNNAFPHCYEEVRLRQQRARLAAVTFRPALERSSRLPREHVGQG